MFILLCLSVGWAGGLATRSSIDTWYVFLQKPALTPPAWVFAPVWTALYVLMAVAGWLIWSSSARSHSTLKAFFILQLLLNGAWSFLFFAMRSPFFAFIDIIFLLAIILCVVKITWAINRPAAYCFIPYALWVSFATYLNGAFFWLNR